MARPDSDPIRWNPALQVWDPVGEQAPFFMRRPEFHRCSKVGWWAIAFIGVASVLSLAMAIADFLDARLIARVLADDHVSAGEDADLAAMSNWQDAIAALWLVAFIPAAIAFIVWLRRVTANLPSLGVKDPRYGTGWAVGSWFVPILNIWWPLLVVQQAWQAGGGLLRTRERSRDELKAVGTSRIARIWWATFILSQYIGPRFLPWDSEELAELRTTNYQSAVINALSVVAGILACLAVYHVTRRQIEADRWLRHTRPGDGDPEPVRQKIDPERAAVRVNHGW